MQTQVAVQSVTVQPQPQVTPKAQAPAPTQPRAIAPTQTESKTKAVAAVSMAPALVSEEDLRTQLVEDARRMLIQLKQIRKELQPASQAAQRLAEGGKVFSSEETQALVTSLLRNMETLSRIAAPHKGEGKKAIEDPHDELMDRLVTDCRGQLSELKWLATALEQKIEGGWPAIQSLQKRAQEVDAYIREWGDILEARVKRSHPSYVMAALQELALSAAALDQEVRQAVETAHKHAEGGSPNAAYCKEAFQKAVETLFDLEQVRQGMERAYYSKKEGLEERIAQATCAPLSAAGRTTIVSSEKGCGVQRSDPSAWHVTSEDKLKKREEALKEVQIERRRVKADLEGLWREIERRFEKIHADLNRLHHIGACGGVPPVKAAVFGKHVAVTEALATLAASRKHALAAEAQPKHQFKPTSFKPEGETGTDFPYVEPSDSDEEQQVKGGSQSSGGMQKLTLRVAEMRKQMERIQGLLASQREIVRQLEKFQAGDKPARFVTEKAESDYQTMLRAINQSQTILKTVPSLKKVAVEKNHPQPIYLPAVKRMVGEVGSLREAIKQAIKSASSNKGADKKALQVRYQEWYEKFDQELKDLKDRRSSIQRAVERKHNRLARLIDRDRRDNLNDSDRYTLGVLGYTDAEGERLDAYKTRYDKVQTDRTNLEADLKQGWEHLNARIAETEKELATLKGWAFPEQTGYFSWARA